MTLNLKAIEDASGIPMQPHEPIVGEGVFSHESGIHTAGILIHPAIYQFIREEEVGGVHRFIFGKHSGAGAVEEVLGAHKGRLEAQGIRVDSALAQRALDAVKELRARMIESGHTQATIAEHYRRYEALGVSEEALLQLVLKLNAEERAKR